MKGREFSLTLSHLKPSWCLFAWAHGITGFVLAHGRHALSLPKEEWLRCLLATGMWAVCLSGAATGLTFFFHAYPHRERGPTSPGEGPRASLGWASTGLLLIGLAASPVVSWQYFETYLVGLLAVILYVTPPVRLGRIVPGSFVLQSAGHGALTFYAGAVLAGAAALPLPVLKLYLLGFACLMLAFRLIMWHADPGPLLILYGICLANAFGCLGLAAVLSGSRWHAAMLAMPLLGWCLVALAREYAGRVRSPFPGLMAWLVTDVALILLALLR